MIENVAILAGGLATRLRPITEKIPKSLVTVAERPFIEHQLELLKRNGLRRVVLCLGYLGEQVQDLVGDGSRYGLEIAYSFDGPRLLGTGGALAQAAPLLEDDFWVLYGDSYLDFDYEAVADYYTAKTGKLGLMTVFANADRWDTSNVIFEEGRLIKYNKFQRSPKMRYIDYGAAILKRSALARVPAGQPVDLSELYSGLIAEGLMVGYEVTRRFYEVGSLAGLEELNNYLLSEPLPEIIKAKV